MTNDWPLEILRDRVSRAGDIRNEIGRLWGDYLDRKPRRLRAIPSGSGSWFLVIKTDVPMPIRVSTLFGEWLYGLRAALDGLAYYLAVRDSQSNPPPAERGVYFPIFTDAAKFDSPDHRGKMQALSDETFALLRYIQPFEDSVDYRSNVLWWIDELARIDRHRRGHALAAHVMNMRVGLEQPLQAVRTMMPDPPRPLPIDETQPTPILELTAPAGWTEAQIRDHIDYSNATTNVLDVTEWLAGASSTMARFALDKRMWLCEQYILHDIINPLTLGEILASDESSPASN